MTSAANAAQLKLEESMPAGPACARKEALRPRRRRPNASALGAFVAPPHARRQTGVTPRIGMPAYSLQQPAALPWLSAFAVRTDALAAIVAANWNGSRSLEALAETNAQALVAVMTAAQAAAVIRLNRKVRLFIAVILVLSVVVDLIPETSSFGNQSTVSASGEA